MRAAAGLCFGVLVFCGSPWVAAADKQSAQQNHADQQAAIEQIAQRVFNNADKNHNHVLNKNEFQNAQSALAAEVEQLGRSGAIGKPKPHGGKQTAGGQALVAGGSSADKLAKSNHVSQAEFNMFAQSYVEKADQHWQQLNAAAAAQRKAMPSGRNLRRMPRTLPQFSYGY